MAGKDEKVPEAPVTKAAAAEVKTVVHEQDREILEAKDLIPEGVVIADEELYCKVARLGEYFNPVTEASSFRPPLNVAKLKGDARDNVQKALAGKEIK
jgi:hypothetical protein